MSVNCLAICWMGLDQFLANI